MRKKMCEDAKSASDQKEAELLEEWEKQWKATLEPLLQKMMMYPCSV